MTDQQLLDGFEKATLKPEDFSHRAHVRMAYLLVRHHSFEEALTRMRAGLKRLNVAHGTPAALERGYHETVTQAWLHIVAGLIHRQGPQENSDAFCDQNAFLLSPRLLRLFYSRARIMTWDAKAHFVEPDLTALPGLGTQE
jgi:hypothetical protein